MYLNATTDKLEIFLGGTVATNQLQWNVSYQDITSTGMTLPQAAGAGNTNNTTVVDIVAAPAASTTRQVTHINVFNADTATATVTIQKDVSGTNYVLISYAVTSGDTLMWSREDGWRLAKASGGGTISIGTINSQTKSADGAVISGSSLVMQTAEATFPGLVSTGTQTFAGAKTFSSAPTLSTMTAGSVLFAGTSGLLSQDNSNLFWDDANNRLGIGTATPAVRIDSGSFSTNNSILKVGSLEFSSFSLNNSFFGDNIFYNGTSFARRVAGRGALIYFFRGGTNPNIEAQIRLYSDNTGTTGINSSICQLKSGAAGLFAVGPSVDTLSDIITGATFAVLANGNTLINTTTDAGFRLDVNGTTRLQGDVTISDTRNIILATGTGTKIGTATTQKLGFWNAAPNVQPTNAIAAAAFVANTSGIVDDTATFGGYTMGQVVAALKRIGALA
jgi:hypothetical protein